MQIVYLYIALLIIPLVVISLLFFNVNTKTPDFNNRLTDLSIEDRQYAESTKDLPAVQAFLEKYSNASIRLEGNWVEYYLESSPQTVTITGRTIHITQEIILRIPVETSMMLPQINRMELMCFAIGDNGMTSNGWGMYPNGNKTDTIFNEIEHGKCFRSA